MSLLGLTACTTESAQTDSSGNGSTISSSQSSSDIPASAYLSGTRFKPFVSAHRGGAAYAPEDTMTAYRNVARMGVEDFETDSTLTADGKLVLIHDASLDRTTNCSGNVVDKAYAEILKCDAGYYWTFGQSTTRAGQVGPFPYRGKGIRIPLAEELFSYAKSLGPFGPTVTIEIKNLPNEAGYEVRCPKAAAELVRLIAASGIRERITVQSFDFTCLMAVQQLDPAVQTLYLSFGTLSDNAALARAFGFTYSSPSFSAPDINAKSVSLVQAQGVKVNPYTLDQKADLDRGISYGLDGIITNYPACMMQLQKRPIPARMLSSVADSPARDAVVCP
jgi:glycerophosphoryl diester phosphodiesterase